MNGYAYFVECPRTIDDLLQPHPVELEMPYEIVKMVSLSWIDYENFITDMIADRQFLEDKANLCSKDGDVIRCILIKPHRGNRGVLVVPEDAWVDLAAVTPEMC